MAKCFLGSQMKYPPLILIVCVIFTNLTWSKPVNQSPAYYSVNFGDIQLTAISDGTVPQDLNQLIIKSTHEKAEKERIDALLKARYLTNPVEASINAFLIQMDGRKVLVDTGAGQVFGLGLGGELPNTLRVMGVPPEEITDVLITHVHSDHSGGLTIGGKRVFPNATVHIAKQDIDFFFDEKNSQKTGYAKMYFDQAKATVGPYLESGQVKSFEGPVEALPSLTAIPYPGHTPGSTIFRLTKGEIDVAFLGDLVHVEALQFPEPDIAIIYDVHPEAAIEMRKNAFNKLAKDRVLVAAPHLPYPGLGHISADGKGFKWIRTDFVDRGQ